MSREQDIKRWLENKVDEQAKQIEQLQAEIDMLFASILMSKRAEAEYVRLKALKGGEK
jgi:hypothetical protein